MTYNVCVKPAHLKSGSFFLYFSSGCLCWVDVFVCETKILCWIHGRKKPEVNPSFIFFPELSDEHLFLPSASATITNPIFCNSNLPLSRCFKLYLSSAGITRVVVQNIWKKLSQERLCQICPLKLILPDK